MIPAIIKAQIIDSAIKIIFPRLKSENKVIVKELENKIEQQDARIEELEKQVGYLSRQIKTLK